MRSGAGTSSRALRIELRADAPAPGQARARADGLGAQRRVRPDRRRRVRAPRRGAPPRQEAGDAADYYAQRFKDLAKDAGEQLDAAGKQVGEWLRAGGDKLRGKDDESSDG